MGSLFILASIATVAAGSPLSYYILNKNEPPAHRELLILIKANERLMHLAEARPAGGALASALARLRYDLIQ